MTPSELDMVPTSDLWDAIKRRTTAALLVVQRDINGQPGFEEREVLYSGGLANAMGLADIADKHLDCVWHDCTHRREDRDRDDD